MRFLIHRAPVHSYSKRLQALMSAYWPAARMARSHSSTLMAWVRAVQGSKAWQR